MRLAAVDLNGEHDRAARSWSEEDGATLPVMVDGGRGAVAVGWSLDGKKQWIAGEEAQLSTLGLGPGWGSDGDIKLRRSVAAALSAETPVAEISDAAVIAAAIAALAGAASRIVVLTDPPSPGLPRPDTLRRHLRARVATVSRAALLRDDHDRPVLSAVRGKVCLEAPGRAPVVEAWGGTVTDVLSGRIAALMVADPGLDPDLLRRQLHALWSDSVDGRIGGGAVRDNFGRFRQVPVIGDPPAPCPALPSRIVAGFAPFGALSLWSPCREATARLATAVSLAAPGLALECIMPEAPVRVALTRATVPGGFLAMLQE